MKSRLAFVIAFGALSAVLTLLLSAGTARPCPPSVVVTRTGGYVTPAHAVEMVHHDHDVLAVEFATVAVVAVPQVAVGYAPQQAPPAAQAQAPAAAPAPADDVQALRKELAELRKKLEALKAGAPAPEAAPAARPSLAAKYCAGCHSPSNAKASGDGHMFFDGAGSLTATDAQVRKMLGKLIRQQMPPAKAPQPSDEDAAALADELAGPR